MCDIRVNSYMNSLLSAWQSNHDIQYILDAYSCVAYICDYMTESQKGMSTLMRESCREAKQGNLSLKENVHHMANKFLNAVESSEMEACYDMLQLPITQTSVKKEYISTS